MCKLTGAQIAADGRVIGDAVTKLAQALSAQYPDIAAKLTAAGNALINVTSTWQSGDTLAVIEDAESVVLAVLNLVPVTTAYAPLVAIAFEGLNLLLANAKTQTQQTANPSANMRIVIKTADKQAAGSHWEGKAHIQHHFLRTPRQDFEAAWNETAPALGVAKVTL